MIQEINYLVLKALNNRVFLQHNIVQFLNIPKLGQYFIYISKKYLPLVIDQLLFK